MSGTDGLTDAVVASFEGSGDPRFRRIAESLVRHLHAFLADVELTEAEWFAAIDFLTRAGHITDDRRQEFVLLSDVLGVSMQVVTANDHAAQGATASTVFGPFFVEGAPVVELGDDIAGGAPGSPCHVSGQVRSVDGIPVAGALVDVWQSDDEGLYDVQRPELDELRGRARMRTDEDGRFHFWSVLPVPYPIPDDGPVGDLLTAGGRGPMRPAHVHLKLEAPGFHDLITHVFLADDPHLDSDAVFGVRESLITKVEDRAAGDTAPDGRVLDEPFHVLRFDPVLAPR